MNCSFSHLTQAERNVESHLSLWELEIYDASTVSRPIPTLAKFVMVVYRDKRLLIDVEKQLLSCGYFTGQENSYYIFLLSKLMFVCLKQWQFSRSGSVEMWHFSSTAVKD